jgi:hypothetical protein
MNNEISQEAQASIAKLNQRKARERLERDGAHSSDAVRRRVRAIAEGRNLPPPDFAKLMHKLHSGRHAVLRKHKISFVWLLCGDLRGLQRMTQEAKATPHEINEAQRKEVMQLFSALSPRMQTVALGCMQELLSRGNL